MLSRVAQDNSKKDEVESDGKNQVWPPPCACARVKCVVILRTITVPLCQAIFEESDGDEEFVESTDQAETVGRVRKRVWLRLKAYFICFKF